MTGTGDIIECPGRREYANCVKAAAEAASDKSAFADATVLVTGATGMVGGALCRTLLYLNRVYGLRLKLLCPVRSEAGFGRLPGIYGRDEARVFVYEPDKTLAVEGKVDYVVHAASPTASAELRSSSADVIKSGALGILNMLELCREKQPRGMVFLSSMEAYGAMNARASEDTAGYIDLTSPRSCYPEAKRFGECACACYASQYGVNALSARLAQVVGAGIKPGENRAYAAFAKSALRGENITLKTAGASMGNYVHVSDAVSGILTLLTKGAPGQIYNVCGDGCSLTVAELAQLIGKLLSDGKSKVVRETQADGKNLPFAPDTGIILDNSKLKALGWSSRFGLEDMILSLGRDLAELKEI